MDKLFKRESIAAAPILASLSDDTALAFYQFHAMRVFSTKLPAVDRFTFSEKEVDVLYIHKWNITLLQQFDNSRDLLFKTPLAGYKFRYDWTDVVEKGAVKEPIHERFHAQHFFSIWSDFRVVRQALASSYIIVNEHTMQNDDNIALAGSVTELENSEGNDEGPETVGEQVVDNAGDGINKDKPTSSNISGVELEAEVDVIDLENAVDEVIDGRVDAEMESSREDAEKEVGSEDVEMGDTVETGKQYANLPMGRMAYIALPVLDTASKKEYVVDSDQDVYMED